MTKYISWHRQTLLLVCRNLNAQSTQLNKTLTVSSRIYWKPACDITLNSLSRQPVKEARTFTTDIIQTKSDRLLLLPLHHEKVSYLSQFFQITDDKAKEILKQLEVKSDVELGTLKRKLNLLLSYKISLEAILNQFLVLNLTLFQLQCRLDDLWVYDVNFSQDSETHLKTLMSSEFGANVKEKKTEYLVFRLNVSTETILNSVQRHPELISLSLRKLKINLDILLKDGFMTSNIILQTATMLTLSSEHLQENLNFLKQLILEEVKDSNDRSALCESDILKLQQTTENSFTTLIMLDKDKQDALQRKLKAKREILGHMSREEYLAQRLNCDVATVQGIVHKNANILSMKISKLKRNLDCLLMSGYIKTQDIIKFPNILTFNTETLEKRIQQISDLGFNFEKRFVTMFRRANDEYFSTVTLRFLIEQEILKDANCVDRNEYIKTRLSCTDDDLEDMLKRYSLHQTMHLTKLKAVLDFVLEECQITPQDVVQSPRIFMPSVETMRERKKEMDELRVPISIYLLWIHKKKYNSMIKSNQNAVQV